MPQHGLPMFFQALELINSKQKKKPWHNYKRGRKRHGLYRKQAWVKRQPPNTYEPSIVPKFRFKDYRKKIQLKIQGKKIEGSETSPKIFHIEKHKEVSKNISKIINAIA